MVPIPERWRYKKKKRSGPFFFGTLFVQPVGASTFIPRERRTNRQGDVQCEHDRRVSVGETVTLTLNVALSVSWWSPRDERRCTDGLDEQRTEKKRSRSLLLFVPPAFRYRNHPEIVFLLGVRRIGDRFGDSAVFDDDRERRTLGYRLYAGCHPQLPFGALVIREAGMIPHKHFRYCQPVQVQREPDQPSQRERSGSWLSPGSCPSTG